MIGNFSWVLPGRLAGFGAVGPLSERDLQQLHEQGIGGLVTLTEDRLPGEVLERSEMRYLHLPIVDMSPPSLQEIQSCVRFIDEVARDTDRAVAIHCRAGLGRTGTMLASYLVRTGIPWREAIDRLRLARPGSVETHDQERAVEAFARAAGSVEQGM